jgi:hypothetical protein
LRDFIAATSETVSGRWEPVQFLLFAITILARMVYVSAKFNVLLELYNRLNPDTYPFRMNITEFTL